MKGESELSNHSEVEWRLDSRDSNLYWTSVFRPCGQSLETQQCLQYHKSVRSENIELKRCCCKTLRREARTSTKERMLGLAKVMSDMFTLRFDADIISDRYSRHVYVNWLHWIHGLHEVSDWRPTLVLSTEQNDQVCQGSIWCASSVFTNICSNIGARSIFWPEIPGLLPFDIGCWIAGIGAQIGAE